MSSRKYFKKGMVPVWPDGLWAYGFVVPTINPQILAHLLRMVMEPKNYAEEVIGHPNHSLTI